MWICGGHRLARGGNDGRTPHRRHSPPRRCQRSDVRVERDNRHGHASAAHCRRRAWHAAAAFLRRGTGGRLQRRDLQLHRAARAARSDGRAVPDAIGHGSAGECAGGVGLSRARKVQRHVRLRCAATRHRRIPGGARSVRREAALRDAIGDGLSVLLGNEAAARHGRNRRRDVAAAGLHAVAQDVRALPVGGCPAPRSVRRQRHEDARSHSGRSRASQAAGRSAGRGLVFGRHRFRP